MSKFDDLCTAYKDYRAEFSAVRHDAIGFSGWLASKYLSYLGLSNESTAFRLVPLNAEEKVNSSYSAFGATHLADDGYWYMGVRLTIYQEHNMHPQLPLLIGIKFLRNENGSHNVGLMESDLKAVISGDDDGREINAFFDLIQREIKKLLKEQVDFIKGKHIKMNRIGFIQNQIDENLKCGE